MTVERGGFDAVDASVSVRVLDITCKYQQTVRHLAAGLLTPLDLSLSPQLRSKFEAVDASLSVRVLDVTCKYEHYQQTVLSVIESKLYSTTETVIECHRTNTSWWL